MRSVPMCARLAIVLLALAARVEAEPGADAAFQAHARDFAAHTHRTVVTWGTAHMDGSTRPYRFALLAEVPTETASGVAMCGDRDCRGAYVIEAAPDAIWTIAFAQERTRPVVETMRVTGWRDDWYADAFDLTAGTPPERGEPGWQVVADPALRFKAMHNHGQLDVLFALRGGAPVVLDLEDSNREDTRIHYAKRGACARPCPTLASFVHTAKNAGADAAHAVMHMWMNPAVAGPAKWADLREPATPPPPL